MAYHFSANQFEDQYSPRKLGNWEYPKWYPDRPRQRFKSTKVIADDNGRLLKGIKKGNAWGNYVGTWDLPKRITREYVNKLVAPPERLVKLWGKKRKEEKQQQEPVTEETGKDVEEKKESLPTIDHNSTSSFDHFQKRNKSSSALNLQPRSTKLEPLASLQQKNKSHRVKPGSLDEKIKNILESVKEAQDKAAEPPELVCQEIKAFPKRSRERNHGIQSLEELKPKEEKQYEYFNHLEDHLNKFEKAGDEEEPEKDLLNLEKLEEEKSNMEKPEKSPEAKPPKSGLSNFQIAKRFHDENLRHKPLPDVIDDPVFKALNSGKESNSRDVLGSMPSAIGWKPYSAPRPTECSKLKVFRPKTGAEKQKLPKDLRPKTSDSTSKKHFLPIDLAICWDLKPEDPSDEPKRSPHIDGSNGSVAPAVFTMIRPTEPEECEQNVTGSSQALIERITKGIDENNATTLPSQLNGKTRSPMPGTCNKEAIMSCVRSGKGSQRQSEGTPESLNSISPNAAEYARRHPKTAWTKEDTSKVLSERLQNLQKENDRSNGTKKYLSRSPSESSELATKKLHQSTPNLTTVCDGSHCGTEKSSLGSFKAYNDKMKSPSTNELNQTKVKAKDKSEQKKRNCSACKNANSDSGDSQEKAEFKQAFKAGVPRSNSTNTNSSSGAKSYKVPKMRFPYAKRSYSIGTLAPPFSLWRERTGQEYPEHWRLASVYQHSYKPINFRKRPLLASVYQ